MSMAPSVASRTLTAMRSGEVPRPGKFFGQVVTIFSCLMPWAMAGVGKAAVAAVAEAAAAAPTVRNCLRFMLEIPLSLE